MTLKGDPRGNGQPKEYLISKVNIDDIKGERGLPIIPTALIYQDVDTGIMYFSDPQSNGRGGSNLKKYLIQQYLTDIDLIQIILLKQEE